MIRRALVALLLAGAAARLSGQVVRVADRGPGPAGRMLEATLAAPHKLIPPDGGRALVARDSSYPTSVVVLGRDVNVEGQVHGDVVVVGGNLFMHPGGHIDGVGVAIGGGAYPSALATVGGGLRSYPDFTYDIARGANGEYLLHYRVMRSAPSPFFTLPAFYGLRIPSYDRTNGLSVPVAPILSIDTGLVEIEPTATYRSQLGVVDPSIDARWVPSRRLWGELRAGRETFTNEKWIRGDIANSALVLLTGTDSRNYYRADRVQARVHRLWETSTAEIEPYVGARYERNWAIRPLPGATSHPWSLWSATKPDRTLRPNPAFTGDHIASALVGARLAWESQGVRIDAEANEELATVASAGTRFARTDLGFISGFPTFGSQRLRVEARTVFTIGDSAPPARWGWLGGSGTFPLIPLLSEGGDQLLFIESDYSIPIQRIVLPMVGSPTLTLRHMMGGAGVGSLPALEQNVGLRLSVLFVDVDLVVDPTRRRSQFGVGASFSH